MRHDQFAPELLHFSDCILEDRSVEPSGLEGLADVRIVLALQRAARTRRAVMLDPVARRRRPDASLEMRKPPVREPKLVEAEAPHAETCGEEAPDLAHRPRFAARPRQPPRAQAGGGALVLRRAVALAFGATGFYVELQDDLDLLWGVPARKRAFVVNSALSVLARPIESVTGAAGSLVLELVWVYYSALIVLFGAVLTWRLSGGRRHVTPAEAPTLA